MSAGGSNNQNFNEDEEEIADEVQDYDDDFEENFEQAINKNDKNKSNSHNPTRP